MKIRAGMAAGALASAALIAGIRPAVACCDNTVTTVTATPSTAGYGRSVSLYAHVCEVTAYFPYAPGGSVEFIDETTGTTLGVSALIAEPLPGHLQPGCSHTTMSFSNLSLGLHRIGASYYIYRDSESNASIGYVNVDIKYVDASPFPADFGDQLVGTSSAQKTITFTPLVATTHFSSVALGNAEFTVVSENCSGRTIAIGSSCAVNIVFTPSAEGSRSASLTVPDDAPDGPEIVPLAGRGIRPHASAPRQIDFGTQAILKSTAAQNAVIANTGTAPLHIASASLGLTDIDFQISSDGCSKMIVAPGASCSIGITFTPLSPGPKSATLTITSDAPESPNAIKLSGNGIAVGVCPGNGLPCV